ncbi:guanine nucleotide exchange factor [Zopfochytrium polystomum]|nr:guanine nucleotide exchange factor [Zopfochytrium polystomum]
MPPQLPSPTASTPPEDLREALVGFLAIHATASTFVVDNGGAFSLEDKSHSVAALVQNVVVLRVSDPSKWPDQIVINALNCLRVLARERQGCGALYEIESLSALITLGSFGPSEGNDRDINSPVSLESLKCLVNCLHQSAEARAAFESLDGPASLADAIKHSAGGPEARFLMLRLLFLATGHSALVSEQLATKTRIADHITEIIEEYALRVAQHGIRSVNSAEQNVLSEALKVLFNLTLDRSEFAGAASMFGLSETKPEVDDASRKERRTAPFKRAIPFITTLITSVPVDPNTPLPAPVSHAVHSLLNFPVSPASVAAWVPIANSESKTQQASLALPNTLCDVISYCVLLAMPFAAGGVGLEDYEKDGITPVVCGQNADEVIAPPVLVLEQLVRSSDEIKAYVKSRLAPENINRAQRLDNSDNVTSRLIRLMTSVSMERTKTCVSDLLFALCNSNASELTLYVGYGNAAGYLFNRGITSNPLASGANDQIRSDLDPITGELKSSRSASAAEEARAAWDALSDEEKENEARRLAELMDRLNQTGVIKAVPKSGAN